MQEANQDLLRQREILHKLFFYDDELNVYIEKATDKVKYLERKVWQKKVLLFTLIVALGVIIAISLLMKLLN